jgi:CheY-like chemotaxis protein
VAKSMLEQLGHAIDIVNNGMQAIRAVQQHQYDLILMVWLELYSIMKV